MNPIRILVVFYSRTGTTQAVAHALVRELGCDIERIAEAPLHGASALLRPEVSVEPTHFDPSAYDLVVVGTPTRKGTVPRAVRSYLASHGARIARVAFFCTHESRASTAGLRRIAATCGRPVVATLALENAAVRRRTAAYGDELTAFASALRAALPRPDRVGVPDRSRLDRQSERA